MYKKFSNITECVFEFCMINNLNFSVEDDAFEISNEEESMNVKTNLSNIKTDKYLATFTLNIEYTSTSQKFGDEYISKLYQFISTYLEGVVVVN